MTCSRWQRHGPAISTIALAAILAPLGCSTLGERSHEVRAAIVGSNERNLLRCLGPPDDFTYDEHRHDFLYRLDLRGRDFAFGRPDLSQPAFCNLLFQIDQGRISDLHVRGIDGYGLNADSRCTVIAGECLASLARAQRGNTASSFVQPARWRHPSPMPSSSADYDGK